MSTTYENPSLDIEAQIARIRRDQEEARTFAAEQHKLAEEAAKLRRDRWLAPFVIAATLGSGFFAALVTRALH